MQDKRLTGVALSFKDPIKLNLMSLTIACYQFLKGTMIPGRNTAKEY